MKRKLNHEENREERVFQKNLKNVKKVLASEKLSLEERINFIKQLIEKVTYNNLQDILYEVSLKESGLHPKIRVAAIVESNMLYNRNPHCFERYHDGDIEYLQCLADYGDPEWAYHAKSYLNLKEKNH